MTPPTSKPPTLDELESAWRALPPVPRDRGTVRWICVRNGEGVHECPDRILISVEGGALLDRWAAGPEPDPERQVTIIRADVAALVAAGRLPLHAAGDNFGVDFDLGEETLPAGTRLRIGGAVLEVSARAHTGCAKFRDRFGEAALRWVNQPSGRLMRLRGVNCRVSTAGEVAVGDRIERLL
ncbi:MAG: MOSC domain-containing protein [Deltaproteobacteria bacterium]|nr:MOSC domain-containing protein [Deltaproteobacteria bacterium]